ncbi:hypothetical protein [Endozoicomonas sp. Mp262]|uniref:hypothetical protein n=1 Tax=Endozoicomonas sp. Mp262 TaxID=2919499 RepID=UPI0021DB183B
MKGIIKLECPSEQAANEIGWRFKSSTLVMGKAVLVLWTKDSYRQIYRQRLRLEAKEVELSEHDKEAAYRLWPCMRYNGQL